MGGNDYEDDFENDSSSSKKTNPPAAAGAPQQHPMPTAVPITAVAPSYAVPSAPLGSQISAPYSYASQPVPSVPMPTTGSIVALGAGPSMPVPNVIGTQRPVVPQAYPYSANTPSYPVNAVPSAAVVAQLHTTQLP
ncbi:GPI-anchored surface protein, putative, partial [Bodo saltans]